MTTGEELSTFITGLNGGAAPDPTLLSVLVRTAQTVIEEERPWMVLRKTDTSKTVTTANTWQTAISIASISDFSRFLEDSIITLSDGANRNEKYIQKPFDRRLDYKDVSNTFVYDANTKTIYLNGIVPFAGTLYINYVSTSTPVDITSDSDVWALFPSRFLPVLGYYAVGIFKGAVDYDSINRQMLPENRNVLNALKNAMETWDNNMQLAAIQFNDPSDSIDFHRNGAINRDDY